MHGNIGIDFETELHLASGHLQYGDFEQPQKSTSASDDD
jgi:hypothetical protein